MLKKFLILSIIVYTAGMTAYSMPEDDLAAIEAAKYGSVFADESLGERLNRLETDFFGMSQTGSLDSRINALSKINSNIRNGVNFPAAGSSFYNTKPKGILSRIWDNLSSGFDDSGYLTGYTPPIVNTITSSGYFNSLGGNNAQFYNNLPAFCPYDRNAYDRTRYLNRRHHHPIRHDLHRNSIWNNPAYAFDPAHYPYQRPVSGTRTQYYTPPNIETKSSIHILKD